MAKPLADNILEDAEKFRKSNLFRHHYVVDSLINYTKYSVTKKDGSYPSLIDASLNFDNIDPNQLKLFEAQESPRRIKFFEACLRVLENKIIKYNQIEQSTGDFEVNDLVENEILEDAYNLYSKINSPDYIPEKNEFYKLNLPKSLDTENEYSSKTDQQIIEISCKNSKTYKNSFNIALANIKVDWHNQAIQALSGTPDLSISRKRKFVDFINKFEKEYIGTDSRNTSDMLILPEISVPFSWVFELAGFCAPRQKAMIFGTEHIKSCKVCFNLIFTILPIEIDTREGKNSIKDAIVIPRLKNHYSHEEKVQINGHQMTVAVPEIKHYDLFHWCDIYFTAFYCFELSDIIHRSWFRGIVDFIATPEYNPDTNYFSSIVESTARDLSCFMIQVNSSDYGDSRVTKPAKTEYRDPLKVKGGKNDVLLIENLNISKFRKHQFKSYPLQKSEGKKNKLKPSPPDFDTNLVQKRIKNLPIFNGDDKVC